MGEHLHEKYTIGAHGVPQIVSVRPLPQQQPDEEQHPMLGDDFPFCDQASDFVIRDSMAITNRDDRKKLDGIIVFEIRPESWTLIYVHTQKLKGYESFQDDDGGILHELDYYSTPIETIHDGFQGYINGIIRACKDYLNNHSLSEETAVKIVQTISELEQSQSCDFTIDVYVPPKICDLTGERYFRPGGELYYATYDNPLFDIDHIPPRPFLQFLHKLLTVDVPENNLTLSCDDVLAHEYALKRLCDHFRTYTDPDHPPRGQRSRRSTSSSPHAPARSAKQFHRRA